MTYELLDSGHFKKLERIGGHIMVRPCPQACWAPILPKAEWKKAKDTYLRSSKGGGKWQSNSLPSDWTIEYKGQKMLIRPTNFGHLGIFSEAAGNWEWLRQQAKPGLKALNMFAYTGGSSLAMAKGGAQVTHLDAAKALSTGQSLTPKRMISPTFVGSLTTLIAFSIARFVVVINTTHSLWTPLRMAVVPRVKFGRSKTISCPTFAVVPMYSPITPRSSSSPATHPTSHLKF